MFIHDTDQTELKIKIDDNGDLFLYCPKCKRLWTGTFKAMRQSRTARTAPNLRVGTSGSGTRGMRSQDRITKLARKAFPTAFK
jgi:hypothetical protein